MKATIEIPDDLYRRVKAKSALQGRTIREVTMELYQSWLVEAPSTPAALSPEQWLEEWLKLADATMQDAPPGPSARELLEEDRNRLEPR
ncbi:MAG: hypothetical protein ACK4SA_21445 [Caldilinea sp.]